ncbi:MAG TPA: AbrB/MazE/SpoVT family DNA-binding domain-containing protein [Planctomycetota bacterium]|nr:AbrB/MazE/SpoVT family DNA-binding domain-containing protein [Planctomycetota bacterium]
MQTRVQKWGNSLAVRIPKSFLDQSKLKRNSLIDMSFERGKIVILPARKKKRKYTLAELVKGITKENRHEEIGFGPPAGKEIFEYES